MSLAPRRGGTAEETVLDEPTIGYTNLSARKIVQNLHELWGHIIAR